MWPLSPSYPERDVQDLENEYDYIILGGGTAGCVLANRLSSDPSLSVLLVERGAAEDTWVSRVPLLSTDFSTVGVQTLRIDSLPQTHVGGRRQELFRGSVLGGTSRINSMLYTRGLAAEFDAWSAAGRKGWSYDEVLPLFKKSERCVDEDAGPERGRGGEWATRVHDRAYFQTTARIFEAGTKLGLPYIADANSSSSPAVGCSKACFTLDEKGYRQSTFNAFLPSTLARKRKSHLAICTKTIATKIDIRSGPGGTLRAEGVHLRPTATPSPTAYVSAKREVILCCGPLGNPQLLQLSVYKSVDSGVGPQQHLKSLGIPVMKDLPGVGSNLQDHLAVPIVYNVPLTDSLVSVERQLFAFLREFLKYLILGTGLLLSPVLALSIFARSDLLDEHSHLQASAAQLDARNPENLPDIEIMPIAYDGTGIPFDKSDGAFSFLSVLLRPQSSGTVLIASSDPAAPVACDLGTLAAPHDWRVLRAALRLALALARQMRADGYALEDARVPAGETDAALDAHIRKWARTSYHYASTCRMAPERGEDGGGAGAGAAPGVVDDALRVHGVRGLRVADSSVFPQVIATHLQAPTVMVAEKCAELLEGERLHRAA